MKYIKFTYVDAITNISIVSEPAINGPKFPEIVGLEFGFARESQYPTDVPEFFGTCPDTSNTDVDGVFSILDKTSYDQAYSNEMFARVPKVVTMRQARLILNKENLLARIETAIATLDEPEKTNAQIEWEYSSEVHRDRPFVNTLRIALGLTNEQIDELFIAASKL